MTTRTKVVRIGNSRGIRIPKALLQQCRLEGPLELEVQGSQLVVRATSGPRAGWEAAFRAMHQRGDDRLFDPDHDASSQWEREEWRW